MNKISKTVIAVLSLCCIALSILCINLNQKYKGAEASYKYILEEEYDLQEQIFEYEDEDSSLRQKAYNEWYSSLNEDQEALYQYAYDIGYEDGNEDGWDEGTDYAELYNHKATMKTAILSSIVAFIFVFIYIFEVFIRDNKHKKNQ